MRKNIRRWLALLMGIMMLLSAVPAMAQFVWDPNQIGQLPVYVVTHSHEWVNSKTIKEATCTSKGEVRQRCTGCGETRVKKTDYAAHKYGAWYVVTEPGEYNAGVEARECAVCGKVQERDLYPEGTLKKGANGDNVRDLQQNLNDAGYNCGNPDGSFGKNTESAVKAAQEALGMNADGIAWPGLQQKLAHEWSEWYVLTPATDRSKGVEERKCVKPDCGKTEQREFYPEGTLKRGDEGDAVLGLQEMLNENGYDCGAADGDFGGKTERAVKAVEATLGMEQDGIAWPAVQAAFAPKMASATGGLVIEKALSNEPANGEYFTPGETALFTITVRNETDVDMVSVEVLDSLDSLDGAVGIDEKSLGVIHDMAAGDVKTFVFPYVITETDVKYTGVSNIASAIGYDADKNEYNASSDPVDVPCGVPAEEAAGEVTFVKSASVPGNGVAFMEGEKITYMLTVTNNTDQTISDVEISDPLKGGNEDSVVTLGDVLAPGASQIYSFDYTVKESDVTAGQVVNTANLRWWIEETKTRGEIDSNTVIVDTAASPEAISPTDGNGALTMVQSVVTTPANGAYYVEGEQVRYQVVVTNESDKTLYTVRNYSLQLNGFFMIPYEMKPGSVASDQYMFHIVTAEDVARGYIENTAVIEWSEEPRNGAVQSTTSNTVTVQTGSASDMPGVSISIRENDAPSNGAYYVNGETITYEVTVRNSGNADAGWYRVDGMKVDGYNNSLYRCSELGQGNAFAAGQEQTFTYDYVVDVHDLDFASVIALAGIQFYVGDEEHNIYSNRVESPVGGRFYKNDLFIEKRETSTPANGQFYVLGETVTYEITVKNNGDVAATDVRVTDTMINPRETEGMLVYEELGELDQLAPGESKMFTFSHVVDEWNVKHGEMWNHASMTCTYDGDDGSAGSGIVKSPTGVNSDVSDTLEPTPETNESFLGMKKTVAGAPANGMYYVPGEVVHFVICLNNFYPMLTDVVVEDALASAPLATVAHMSAGETLSWPFDYTVTEWDAASGSLTNVATITATDDRGVRVSFSDSATVTTGSDVFGVISEMTIVKTVTNTPANDSYYEEGETITYDIKIRNDGETPFGECIIYDSQTTGNISHVEHLYVGEERHFPHSHTVTATDVDNGYVLNTAWVEFDNGGYTETKKSNTVISDTDSIPENFDPEAPGFIETPVLPSGEGYVPCSHELISKGDNGEEILTHYCELHADTQEAVAERIAAAATDDEMLSAWTKASALWRAEIDEMYEAMMNAADPIAKINIMDDRIRFYTAVGCHEKLLSMIYPDAPAQVASMIAEALMNKCVDMCYELHTAPEDRIDAFEHVNGFDFDLPCGEECAWNVTTLENGDIQIAEQLCDHHAAILQIRNQLIADAENAEEAWATVGQLWKIETNIGYNGLYIALNEDGQATVLADYKAFENSAAAHEKVLRALYDRPEVVNEVLAQIMKDRATEICNFK